jgi:hypothetical protein
MSALDTQVGGDHYKSMAIQPAEYIVRNGIGFLEGMVIKYVSRWEKKGGIEDLEKAIHCLQLRVEMLKQGTEVIPVPDGQEAHAAPETLGVDEVVAYFSEHGTVRPTKTEFWGGIGK